MSSGRTVKLYTGQEIPAVGLGTWVCHIDPVACNQTHMRLHVADICHHLFCSNLSPAKSASL
jgi:hypothetical protein